MRFFALAVVVGAFAAANSKLHQIAPPMSDGPKQFLFYIDSQSPNVTFNDGFKPNNSRGPPDHSRAGSALRTRRDTTAIHHATGNSCTDKPRYIYILSPQGSSHAASYHAGMHNGSTEKFVSALGGGVEPATIVGAYSYTSLHGKRHVIQEWIANPKYDHANTSPYIAQGNGCLARACAGARHLASQTCRSIISCLSTGGKKRQARRNLQALQEKSELYLTAATEGCVAGEAPNPIAETPSKLEEEITVGAVAEAAEKVSRAEFAKLLDRNKLAQVIKKWSMSIPDARKRLLNYKPLGPESPRLRAGSGGTAAPLTLGAVGAAAWVGGVVEAFTRDASALDRAAAVASIIPLAGCAAGLAAKLEKGEISASAGVDSTMCFLADALILGGLAPIGIVAHLARLVVQSFTPPPEPPSKEEMQSVRDEQWQKFVKNILYTYIYSHHHLYPNGSFANKLENALAIEAIMVISEGAQAIGALNASSRVSGDSNLDQEQLQSASHDAAQKIQEAISVEVTGRQQRFLLALPALIQSNSTTLLTATAEKYNGDFIKKITSQETIAKYRGFHENPSPGGRLPGNAKLKSLVKLMDGIGQYLRETPLPIPDLLEVAFILGQSKGLTKLDPLVLSPQEYMKQHADGASEDHVNRVIIKHALGVLQLLQGKITEQELPTVFAAEDSQSRQGLQVLLAMQIGKVYEEAKVKEADKLAGEYLPESELRDLTRPWTPPLKEHPDAPLLIGLVLGISKNVVEAGLADSSG